MADAALERLLQRDRLIILSALGMIAAIAWGYILWLAAHPSMPGMNMAAPSAMRQISGLGSMPSMPAPSMTNPKFAAWSPAEFGFMFVMWGAMMIGMMTPSAAPMILVYARVGRQAAERGTPLAATSWFAGGYLLAWIAFALVATAAQAWLSGGAAMSPQMRLAQNWVGGTILIIAGLYQWMPLKDRCLVHCRAPLSFIQQHGGFKRDGLGSLRLGLEHGAYCIGCCWLLMALLFVGGVMNLLWVAGLTFLVLGEKIVPMGRALARAAGAAMVAWGAWLIFAPGLS
jgi:predicted metal-binding membrane protein